MLKLLKPTLSVMLTLITFPCFAQSIDVPVKPVAGSPGNKDDDRKSGSRRSSQITIICTIHENGEIDICGYDIDSAYCFECYDKDRNLQAVFSNNIDFAEFVFGNCGIASFIIRSDEYCLIGYIPE